MKPKAIIWPSIIQKKKKKRQQKVFSISPCSACGLICLHKMLFKSSWQSCLLISITKSYMIYIHIITNAFLFLAILHWSIEVFLILCSFSVTLLISKYNVAKIRKYLKVVILLKLSTISWAVNLINKTTCCLCGFKHLLLQSSGSTIIFF